MRGGKGGKCGRGTVFVNNLLGQIILTIHTVVRMAGAMKGLTPVFVILSIGFKTSVSLKCWTTPFGEVGSMTDTNVGNVFVELKHHLSKYFFRRE